MKLMSKSGIADNAWTENHRIHPPPTMSGRNGHNAQGFDYSSVPSLLPEKSRLKYEYAYTKFEKWCTEKNIDNIDEDILMDYFQDKAKVQKPSSLWAQYSMLKTVIMIRKNIDISKFRAVLAFLKKKAVGYQAAKYQVLTRSHIDTYLREADDATCLMMKVALIIGTAGRCKRDELTYLLLDDVKDEGNFFRICLRNTNRDFIILGETINGINLVDIIRRYINLRPPLADIQRFFIAYRNGKCVNQPVGVHTIGGIPKKVATFLGLPNPEAFIGFRSKNTSQSGWPSTNFTEGFNEYF